MSPTWPNGRGRGSRFLAVAGSNPPPPVGGHFGVTLGSSWGHLGVILGSLWGHFGVILGAISGPVGGHFGVILGAKQPDGA